MPSISFDAPPTVARFMRSQAAFRLIAGPIGSGKTTGCIFELLRRACEQRRGPDGLRHTRFAVVRQTYEQLRMTVLKDIESWLQGICRFKVQDKTVFIEFGDVRSEWLLIPLDDLDDQKRLLSSQLTGAWMSEAIEIDVELVGPLRGRCGRYPSAAQGGCTWFGVIADTNMPTEGSDWHRRMDADLPPSWQVFIQPGGLARDDKDTPIAENLNYLTQTQETLALPLDDPARLAQGLTYYHNLLDSYSFEEAERYIHARYGPDPSGSAVFRSTYNRHFHTVDGVEEELLPQHGWPLIIGQDFGRNPCALICQLNHRGQLLVLEEVASQDMGLELHLKERLKPALSNERYAGLMNYIVGDPTGRNKSTTFETTTFDDVRAQGLTCYPAPTNKIEPRIRAVEGFFNQQRGGKAALLIDRKRCPQLVLALGGQYRYQRRKNGQLHPLPEKLHPWSDLADCLQYVCLVAGGGAGEYIATRLAARRAPPPMRQRVSAAGWT